MKRYLILLLVLLFLLSGCHKTNSLAHSASSSQTDASTRPTETGSSVPPAPTQLTETTTPTKATQAEELDLVVFRYIEDSGFGLVSFRDYFDSSTLDRLEVDHLYYFYRLKETREVVSDVTELSDGPVIEYFGSNDDLHHFFLKAAEPTKLYYASSYDLPQYEMVYESVFGEINSIDIAGSRSYGSEYIDLVEGNKRLIMLNMDTGEIQVLFEAYYLEKAFVERSEMENGQLTCLKIWFYGKLTEDSELNQYWYYPETGDIAIDQG